MDITLALGLKVVGGLLVGVSHRRIIRAIKQEQGARSWLAAMLIPGVAIWYGLKRIDQYSRTLLAILFGFAMLSGGLALQVFDAYRNGEFSAQQGPLAQMGTDVSAGQPGFLQRLRTAANAARSAKGQLAGANVAPSCAEPEPLLVTEAPPTSPAAPVASPVAAAAPAPASKAAGAVATKAPSATPAVGDIPPGLQPAFQKLQARYKQLETDRAKLDAQNPDALRAFDLRAADYRTACEQFRSQLELYRQTSVLTIPRTAGSAAVKK